MPSALRNRLIAVGASLLALVFGWQVASGDYALGFLVMGLLALVAVEWLSRVRPEALLLGFLMVGYLLGNRGFAQISPMRSAPVFFGEIGLIAGLGLVIARGALARRLPLEGDWVNRMVLLWIMIGSLRVWYDVRIYGFAALRDFATIYYAGYFFIAQAAMAHATSARWFGAV